MCIYTNTHVHIHSCNAHIHATGISCMLVIFPQSLILAISRSSARRYIVFLLYNFPQEVVHQLMVSTTTWV